MQEIEKRRLMNARRLDRQGSQQPTTHEVVSLAIMQWMSVILINVIYQGPLVVQHEKTPATGQRADMGSSRPTSRLGSVQPFGRSINHPPVPNPAKPPKRHLDDDAPPRPAPTKTSTMQPSGESKRRKTEDNHNPHIVRPTMAPPIRQSNVRKVCLLIT